MASPKRRCYQPGDPDYNPQAGTCFCLVGKQLYGSGCTINGYAAVKFQGAQRDCLSCVQGSLFACATEDQDQAGGHSSKAKGGGSYIDKMKTHIDSPQGRIEYGQRFATVEPVFGNLRYNKQLNHFTLRERKKVDAQWKLYYPPPIRSRV